MRILYLDIDTLRPDHLGCYGYHRNTSPTIDRIAEQGIRFENCYVSDAPCLPSRSSLFTGRFGIHTGVVNHGGINADPRRTGVERQFKDIKAQRMWVYMMRVAGLHTVSVSPFAERHSAWWFYSGFQEMFNTGKSGMDNADEVFPYAEKWLRENGTKDNWFLHVNMWDPHTPYDHPEEFLTMFDKDPVGGWITEEKIQQDYESYGPHSAHEPLGWGNNEWEKKLLEKLPHLPAEIASLDDYKKWLDGYDTGIRFADHYCGKILDVLDELGVSEDTAILVSSDHGENQGELNVYGDHMTADHITSRVPCILKWPGLKSGVYQGLHYQNDIAATILGLLDIDVPATWHGQSIAQELKQGKENPREYLVVSQNAWACQRSVRFNNYILIRTYHTGLKHFPEYMLFDIENDPHELVNLAQNKPDIVAKGCRILEKWHSDMMRTSPCDTDPLWEVMHEGGPYHTRGCLEEYCKRLRDTGRSHHADLLEKLDGKPVDM